MNSTGLSVLDAGVEDDPLSVQLRTPSTISYSRATIGASVNWAAGEPTLWGRTMVLPVIDGAISSTTTRAPRNPIQGFSV